MADAAAGGLAWLDQVKHGMLAQIATALAAPETAGPNIWAALRDMGKNLGVGASPEQADRQERLKGIMYSGSPEGEADREQNSRELMQSFANIGAMLRPGGRPDLMMSHGSSIMGLLRDSLSPRPQLLPDLSNPSIATTRGLSNEFTAGDGALLIPRIGAFDPAYSSSTLFNRDAYVARRNDFPGSYADTPQGVANARLKARFEIPQVPPHSEGVPGYWSDPGWEAGKTRGGHNSAINASPIFRSFAEYENSPKGAGVLTEKPGIMPENWGSGFERDFGKWWTANNPDAALPDDWLAALRQGAGQGDRNAAYLLKSAQTAPSNYGELKVSGPVPLTGDRWAGVLLPQDHPYIGQERLDAIKRAFDDRGIQVGRLSDSPQLNFGLADLFQKSVGPVKEQPLRAAAGWPAPISPNFKIEGAAKAPELPLASDAPPKLDPNPSPFSMHYDWIDHPVNDSFSKIAGDNFHPQQEQKFFFGGSEYTVVPDGTVYMHGALSDQLIKMGKLIENAAPEDVPQ